MFQTGQLDWRRGRPRSWAIRNHRIAIPCGLVRDQSLLNFRVAPKCRCMKALTFPKSSWSQIRTVARVLLSVVVVFSMGPWELLRRRQKEVIIGICSIGGQQLKPAERCYSSRCRAFCSRRRDVAIRGSGGRVNGTRRDGRGQMLRPPSLWDLRIMIRSRVSFVSPFIFMLPPLFLHRLLLVASINQDLKGAMLLRSVLIRLPLSAGGT